ncbi:hypothetical protein KDW60_30140 [Burkholderia cenocepacia]|uniref:hypothetical protein n=1 Tax=Burkholderia cenocepacia TaxID=95486 RepID=UPI001B902702|nr:hypothetical protein [Burkholderia cenocepacia]MBR7940991.1 hypothetical protein [Burkholderia cenocepacia]MBR8479193.1 hypothetical protein [Burkholderia cenocepacia]
MLGSESAPRLGFRQSFRFLTCRDWPSAASADRLTGDLVPALRCYSNVAFEHTSRRWHDAGLNGQIVLCFFEGHVALLGWSPAYTVFRNRNTAATLQPAAQMWLDSNACRRDAATSNFVVDCGVTLRTGWQSDAHQET